MERKMLNLGRAKRKLRYFQPEKSTPCLKIKDVFSLKDLDKIFDDLDSAPGTPLLSPLPKSPGSDEQTKLSQSPVPKSLLPFIGAVSPLKGSDVLEAETAIQVDHLNHKGSPLEEIVPIKTSSPIEQLVIENVAENAEKSETSPLLFAIEDEDPVMVDKSQKNPISESIKDVPHGDSLESPPARFNIRKPTKPNDPVTSSSPQKVPEAPDPIGKTSASEPEEELPRDGCKGGVSLSPVVLIQKHPPEPPPKEQPNKQVQEVAVEVGVKKSLFQEKLRNFLRPQASGKQETLKQPARTPSPQIQDEDFMILEDDCPIRFTIPRKTKMKGKPAPESLSAEPRSKENASPKHTKEAGNLKDGPKKKRKTKHGKDSDAVTKDTAVLSAPEEGQDDVDIDVGDKEPICLSADTDQDADIPANVPLGKKIPKGKASRTKQQLGKGGKEVGAKISAEQPTAKTKQTAKLATSTHTAQEVPVSSVKKKPNSIKSTIQEGVSESIGLSSGKPQKQDKGRRAVKYKKLAEEQEQDAEPTTPPTEQPEVQSTVTVKKANKKHKQGASKKPPKEDKKTQESLKIRELVPESDVFASSKRKRRPPMEWWLTQHSDDNTQEQQEAVQSSQELKPKRKAPNESPVSTDSLEHESLVPVTVQKSQAAKYPSSLAGSCKNPKSARGRRKPKSGAQEQCDMTPALTVEEEARDNAAAGQLSPITCGQQSRQRSVTPGVKRLFKKTYTREGQCGSAQKRLPQLPGAADGVLVKRQRKPPQNWWEVPQSQEPVESSQSLQTSSPQTSRPPMGPPQTAFHQRPSLQKTVGRGRQKSKMMNTPKSVKRSLATFDAIYDPGKPGPLTERERGARVKGRRNLLHSLEDQSEQSSENIQSNCRRQQTYSHATFDVCVSGVVSESSASLRRSNSGASSRSNQTYDCDIALKSGPSSLIELEQCEEHEDAELPSTRIIPETRARPRVLSDCDLCGPPLKPIVLETDDWNNLCIWFAHIWPSTSKNSKSISPDDFHWHCHAGRAMGHMIDLQNNTFSSGKILLGSYMRKPTQMDLDAITVFNIASSCVQVEIEGVKKIYNSGQTFMTPCGQSYSIHNMGQEPAVLWYHRMIPNHPAS